MKPIKILRYILALPVELLQYAALILIVLLGKAFRWLARTEHSMQLHVYMPICTVKRFIQGEPLWNVSDLMYMNIQPTTAKARAIADADKRVTKIQCQCGEDNCALKGKDQYIVLPPGAMVMPPMPVLTADQVATMRAAIETRNRKLEDGTAMILPNGRYAEAATAGELNKLASYEARLAKMTRHLVGCDVPGCTNVLVSHCSHTMPSENLVPPPCVEALLNAHNWRRDGDDNVCPDHDAPVAVVSADAAPLPPS